MLGAAAGILGAVGNNGECNTESGPSFLLSYAVHAPVLYSTCAW